MEILNARPKDMSFNDYRAHLEAQKQYIKRAKLGRLVWASNGIPEMTYVGLKGELLLVPRFLRWLQEPQGTFRRGYQMLAA